MKVISRLSIGILIGVISALLLTTSAFAVTSIQHGWIALDTNKNPVLQGSQYSLSGAVKPVKYITNGVTTTAVNSKAVLYLGNTKVCTAQALVIGDNIPGYKDAFITTFTIVKPGSAASAPAKISLSSAKVTGLENKTYTGKAQTQSKMKVAVNGTTLKNKTDYIVAYKNNTKAGTATVTITGKGNYTGTKTATFKINAKSIALAKVTAIPEQSYTGKAVTPNVTVKIGSTKLKKNRDYKLTYKNNKKLGTATVTITGKGNYNKSKKASFKIVVSSPSSTKIKNVNGDGYYQMITLSGKTFKIYKQNLGSYTGNFYNSTGNWGSGAGTIRNKGCGPTSCATVLSAYNRGDGPGAFASWCLANHSKPSGIESMAAEMRATGVHAVVHEYTRNYKQDYNALRNALTQGHQIVMFTGKPASKDYWKSFTSSGYHFIAVLGIDAQKNKVFVGNPNNNKTTGWFDFSHLVKARGWSVNGMKGWIEVWM